MSNPYRHDTNVAKWERLTVRTVIVVTYLSFDSKFLHL